MVRESMKKAENVPVSDFFAERAVFVTGATGFLGKVLVEKLLRSCPGVKVIYLLMRPKRGRDLEARLADIIDSPLFERLKRELPTAVNKIIPIQGDIGEPDLGISQADQEILTQNVSIVFHSAATVRFNEPMKVAVQINLLGTKRVVELCRRMPGLQALVHVSTCYSNFNLDEVLEVVYPPPYDPDHIAQLSQWMDDETMKQITPILLGKRPNTYTFTKALAESMIVREGVGLPIAIVRPAIITATWQEPFAGWIEGVTGLSGIILAYSGGMLRTMMGDGKSIADLIPADVVVNLLIVAAWKTATDRQDHLMVYNSCSGASNPITYKQYFLHLYNSVRSNPSQHIMWYPKLDVLCMNKRLHTVKEMLLHSLPAYLVDGVRWVLRKKPIRLVQKDQKIRGFLSSVENFVTRGWQFKDDNTLNLNKCLSNRDQQAFYFDVRGIDWPSYMEDYVLGVRSHVCKELPDTLPQSRVALNRLIRRGTFSNVDYLRKRKEPSAFYYNTERLLWLERASLFFGWMLMMQAVLYVIL